jgi:hypothetical protein
LRLALENSSVDPISKMTRAKWTGAVAQVIEHFLKLFYFNLDGLVLPPKM